MSISVYILVLQHCLIWHKVCTSNIVGDPESLAAAFPNLFLVLSPTLMCPLLSVRIAELTHSLEFDDCRREAEGRLQAVSQAVMKLVSVE